MLQSGDEGFAVDDLWTWEFSSPGLVPDVSIIICAHGHSDVTLRCIRAVLDGQRWNLASAEVILVDDASPDNTLDLVSRIKGLRVKILERNHGFLRAANAGLQIARGRHILFLNNDTEPVGQWLDPLVETLTRRPRALCVGSRLVYPDGSLQEAGGIIFSDGSGWNYGKGFDSFDPRVTFERQVDYASGASLLVDGEFLRARGGFDDRYAPAYYEDTDLCFAAREAGGEVWYQPDSIVVHHEGVSHGTSKTSGLKAFQGINKVKFAKAWQSALARQYGPDAANVPIARQRAAQGRILVIDNEVPSPDRDSGSVRIMAVMEAMLALGYAVTFLPVNGWRREPYVRRLERTGIEVLGTLEESWPRIEEMSRSIRHVWISRPGVAEQVLPKVKEGVPTASLIYDTVDLHFLRVGRQAETQDDSALREEAQKLEVRELRIMDQVDTAVVVSPVESEVLASRTRTPIRVIPNVHAATTAEAIPYARKGIIFVGGFRHTPNEDAVEWFVRSVFPLVLDRHPESTFTIVGSHATPRVEALASESVIVAGWIPDLHSVYVRARVAVAPLRFGAGVKGKVGEALSFGLPIVLTPVAAEGMGMVHGEHGLIAEDPEEFAEGVCSLIDDDELWAALSGAGRSHIEETMGVAAVRRLLSSTLTSSVRHREPTWV